VNTLGSEAAQALISPASPAQPFAKTAKPAFV
jgi:hypothetical protein